MLPPFGKHPHVWLVVFQQFGFVALPVKDVPVSSVLVSFILVQVRINEVLFGLGSPGHQLVDVTTGNGDWQQTNWAQNGVTTADTIWDNEGFVTVSISLGLQGSLGLISRGIDPLVSLGQAILFNQLLLQNPEGN